MPLRMTGRGIAVLLGGILVGVVLVAVAAWIYVRSARFDAAEILLEQRLDLPAEAFELEEISPGGSVRIALRDVALLESDGDTIVAAPILRARLNPLALEGEAPIELTDVELRQPFLRIVQRPDGGLNLGEAVRMTANGREVEVEEGEGGGVLLRDVRITDGRVLLATPWEPDTLAGPDARADVRLARIEGMLMRIRTARDLDARLPLVRVGGPDGWRAVVAGLDAQLTDPDLRITHLRGEAEQTAVGGIRFALDEFRTPRSRLDGSGIVQLAGAEGEAASYDFTLRAQPLALGDLRWLVPSLPDEGEARLTLRARPADGRTAFTVDDLEINLPGSRVTGGATVLVGGDAPPVFRDTRILLDPVDLQAIEQFGLAARFPALQDLAVTGQVRGTLATADSAVLTGDTAAAADGSLRLDLAAELLPEGAGADAEPSVVGVVGGVALGGEEAPVRLDDVRLSLSPLHLGLFASLFPEQGGRLQGVVRGGVTLAGVPADLRVDAGELIYEVGTAAPTQLVELSGSITTEPELSYELRGRADPFALGTLTELFPALPFRTAQLSGPITVSGSPQAVRFGTELAGAAGSIAVDGSLTLGDTPALTVDGRVEAFRLEGVFAQPERVPVAGPLTGTFAARGPLDDLRFNVDLTRGEGVFALEGRLRQTDGTPRIEVEGRVADFRLGTLLGRPGLFGEPVTGNIQVAGGGSEAYRFDIDTRGETGVLDLEGWYVPGDVPEYALSGVVTGLDLAELPLAGDALPQTRLNLTMDLEGRGASPDSLAGTLNLAARASTVAGLPLDAAIVHASVFNSVLVVDTLFVSLQESRLAASGTFGLAQPAPGVMNYTLVSPDLSGLAPILESVQGIEPRLAGAVNISGWVGGTLENPAVAVGGRVRDLRYAEWRVGALAIDGEATLRAAGWSGQGTVSAEDVALAGGRTFEAVRFEADAGPESIGFGVFVQRADDAELAASGTLALEDRQPREVTLQQFGLRLDQSDWQLADPTRIEWSGPAGIEVDSLVLRRVGDREGLIAVNGQIPRSGDAAFTMRAEALDLGNIGRLLQIAEIEGAPELGGVVSLDALVAGPVSDPRVSVAARIDQPRIGSGAADTISITARYADGRLDTESAVWVENELATYAQASVPMMLSLEGLSPEFELSDTEALSARLVADSLPLALVVAAIPQVGEGAGILDGEMIVRGTLDQPVLSGSALVTGGALTIEPLGARYRDIGGSLTLENDLVRIDSLTARSTGTAFLSGTVRLDDPERAQVYLTATLNDFRPIDREEISTAHASGQLALSGRLPDPVLTGRVVLSDGTIAIPALGEEPPLEITDVEVGGVGADTIPTEIADPGLLGTIRINGLEAAVAEGVWIESEDDAARVQIDGELLVFRSGIDDLRVYGDLSAGRGTYTLRIGPITREFDVTGGQVQFFGTPDFNPSLDIQAAYRVRTAAGPSGAVLNIIVELTGTVQSPRVQLTSDTRPPIPESDLLSYLIFGRPGFALGGPGGNLAQEILVQELAGSVILNPLEEALLGAGLFDYVRITGRPTEFRGLGQAAVGSTLGSTALEVGWELFAEEVFATIECGLGGIVTAGQSSLLCGTGVQWQIDNQWSTSLSYEPLRRDPLLRRFLGDDLLYQFSTQVRRRWEYGRPENPMPPTPQTPDPQLPGEITAPPPPPPEPEENGEAPR